MNKEQLAEKAREYCLKNDYYHEIDVNSEVIDEIVCKENIQLFMAGYKERDTEVKELKDVILDLFEGLYKIGSKQLESYGEMYEFMASAYTAKHSKLIERLKQEKLE